MNNGDIINTKWGKLIKKETRKDTILFFNILRIFLLMRFFKVKNPIHDYDAFIKTEKLFNNALITKDVFFYNFFLILKNVKKSIILKDKIYIKFLLNKLNKGAKFLFRAFKVLRNYRLWKKFYLKSKKKRLLYKYFLQEKVVELETNESLFIKRFFKNKAKFILLYDYLVYRYKKSFKKKIIFFRKKKINNYSFLRQKIVSYFIYKRRRRKKFIKKKYSHLHLRDKKKRYLSKDKKIEYINKLFDTLTKSKRRFKRVIRRRKFLFRRKYSLIKKYKRLRIKKTRMGILHFRSYYSNYYVTLTDLSYNVICSFSAGSVSESNNKKTKMSKVVAMPIFFRILQYLKAYRIRRLKVVIRNRMDKMFYSALGFFKQKGYKFKSFSFVSRNAHHLGQRTKKPRRI